MCDEHREHGHLADFATLYHALQKRIKALMKGMSQTDGDEVRPLHS